MSPSERFLLQSLIGFVVVASVFLGARTYAKNVVPVARSGGELVEALVGTPQYVNPVLAGSNDVDRDLTRLLFSGLMRRNSAQELVPDIAESFEVSEDQKTYTFRLRDNLHWSDGQSLTADDVVMTFEFIQDARYKSPIRSQLRNARVERKDQLTVVFTLTQPSAAFLGNLAVGILPAHIWADVAPVQFGLLEFNLRPISNGPFAFESLRRDQATIREYHLVRNRYYHGRQPYLNEITLKIFADTLSAASALETKSVESLSVIPRDQRSEMKQAHVVNLIIPHYTALFLNGRRPTLKEVEIRKALRQATDRERIIRDVLASAAVTLDGPIPPNFPGYAGQIFPGYDLDAARSTLDTAGWRIPEGGTIRKKGNDELKLTLTIVDQPEDQAIAQIIKDNWSSIGVQLDIKPFDPQRIPKEIIKPRDYDVLLYGEILSADLDLYPFWHSNQTRDPGLNLTTYFHKDIDKLLEELRTTTNTEQQIAKRQEVQKLMADGAPAIFLYSPYYSYGLTKRIKGFRSTHAFTPADRFNSIEEWYIKTKISFKKK